MRRAPEFGNDNWPAAADSYWDVHIYYGVKLLWKKDKPCFAFGADGPVYG